MITATFILLVIVGVVIALVVGSLWYSDKTPMGKLHMRYVGFSKLSPEEQKLKMEEMKPKMVKMYLGQALLSLLNSFVVVMIVTFSTIGGLSFMGALGFVVLNWLCFVVPNVGGSILWGNCEREIAWKKFFSDIASSLVTLVLIAAMAGVVLM